MDDEIKQDIALILLNIRHINESLTTLEDDMAEVKRKLSDIEYAVSVPLEVR
jgi:hypothetical protein